MSNSDSIFIPLSLSAIEKKPKTILEYKNFKISDKVKENFNSLEINSEVVKIRNLIKIGGDLSDYYRIDVESSSDDLLRKHKVMHLHLFRKSSDVLLYLVQYPEHVIFLFIDTHIHLDDVPPGKKLPHNFLGELEKQIKGALEPSVPQKKELSVVRDEQSKTLRLAENSN